MSSSAFSSMITPGPSGLGSLASKDPMSFRKPPTSVGAATPDQALQVGHQFEQMFLSEMLKPMFDSVKTDPLFGGGHGEEMFRSLQVDEYAKAMSKQGGVGIAGAVQRQILLMQEQTHVPAAAAG